MNVWKRAVLYVLRKRGKTAGLFLLVFVISVFLISCFSILKAAEHLSRDIRTSLGAAFYIRASVRVSTAENGETQAQSQDARITQAAVGQIMALGEIRRCNPINYGFAKSEDIQFIPGEKHTAASSMGKVTALGYSALAPAFAEETAVLLEGGHIAPSDRGKILISEELAQANRLSAGSTVVLTHARLIERDGEYADESSVKTAFAEVEVAGIYRLHTEDAASAPTAGRACNEIYASLDVLVALNESEAGVYTGEVDFYLADPADLEPVVRKARLLPDIDWTSHFIRTNDFQFSRLKEQLSSLSGLTGFLLAGGSAAGTVLLTLLLTMRTRGRVQEVGILLSAGVSKRQVLGQFLLEVLFVAAAALLPSLAASIGVTRAIAGNVLQEAPLRLLNGQAPAGAAGGGGLVSYLRLDAVQTAAVCAAQTGTAVLATLASSVAILRLKPKEILSKMS